MFALGCDESMWMKKKLIMDHLRSILEVFNDLWRACVYFHQWNVFHSDFFMLVTLLEKYFRNFFFFFIYFDMLAFKNYFSCRLAHMFLIFVSRALFCSQNKEGIVENFAICRTFRLISIDLYFLLKMWIFFKKKCELLKKYFKFNKKNCKNFDFFSKIPAYDSQFNFSHRCTDTKSQCP